MDAAGKIKAIASVFIQIKERKLGWMFITFPDIEQETGIPKEEALPICELLKREGFISYIFMPFDDHKKKFSIFDKDEDYQDETGAITFVGITDDEKPFSGNIDVVRLKELTDSNESLEGLARRIHQECRYDSEKDVLISGDKQTKVHSHNQRVVCEKIFAQPTGTVFTESEVAELLDEISTRGKPAKGYRAEYHQLYNVLYQINLKIKKLTGLPKFIKCTDGKIRTG